MTSLRNYLDTILAETPLWNGNVKSVQITECDERWINVRVLVTAENSPKCWDLRCYVREKLISWAHQHQSPLPVQRWRQPPISC